MENNKEKSKFWLYLIPLYIIIAIPLIKWTLKMSSPDINLSEEEMKAFSATAEIKKEEDFKMYEPNLEDLSYTVNYRNANDSKEGKTYRLSEDETTKDKEKNSTEKSENKKDNINLSSEQDIPKVGDIKQKEMSSVGYKKGFLTQAVGKLLNNPAAVKALFNNEYVVKGFLSRDIVKRNLSDPKALESYLSNQQVVSNFLNNETVKQALNNPQVLNAIAQSKLMGEIMSAPAVTNLMNNQDKMNELMTKNPQTMQLLSNPNIMSALSSNPQGAQILSKISQK
ncbi:MAG: hypothetical protein AB1602_05725 [Elusimicrobiota bacterium]